MEGKRAEKTFDLENGKKFIGFKSTAYKEYLAARHLLNDNFLHQAAFFINTCLEKEIKAYLFCLDIRVNIKHDIFKLFNLLNQHQPGINKELNIDFFKTVSKIYTTRYYEDLGPGFNFVMIKNKFLAELDYTFSILESKSRFKISRDSEIRKSNYEIDKENKNPMLFRNNYLLNNISKEYFLNQEDWVYEYRVLLNHEIIEAFYAIYYNQEYNKFSYVGLKPLDDTSYELSQHNSSSEN
jgi:HEPN domain-containing protein